MQVLFLGVEQELFEKIDDFSKRVFQGNSSQGAVNRRH